MKRHCRKRILALCLFLALIVGEGAPERTAMAAAASERGSQAATSTEEPTTTPTESPTGVPTERPSATPTEEPTAAPTENPIGVPTENPIGVPTESPTVTPEPTAPSPRYVLDNKGAKYYKGGQKGIRYHKVKGKKVYHITSYATDAVRLSMSHKSVFTVYGGGSKKEVRKKLVTVSGSGVVRCRKKSSDKGLYTVIQAESEVTGEKQFIYIFFRKKLSCANGSRIKLYEKHSEKLHFNYPVKNLAISVNNKKKARVDKKGRADALKKGSARVTVRVKGSENNQIRIKIIVREEPWIVSIKDRVYNYTEMTGDLYSLRKKYPGRTALSSLGKSWDDRNIWCLRIGSAGAPRKLVINAAIHAREWKNTQLVMRQAEDMLRDYSEYRERFRQVCVYIIPMANPDGVSLAQYGAGAIRSEKLRKRCEKIGHFSVWKNNARGVNLNYNFPSGFSKKKKAKKPDHLSYPGKKKCSEKETKALMEFFRRTDPDAVLNIHSTGSILYWDFNVEGALHERLYNLAAKVNSFNGYRMMPKSGSTDAGGGLADWLVYGRGITSITVETGTVRCPLPHSQLASIYRKNNKMFRWFMAKY